MAYFDDNGGFNAPQSLNPNPMSFQYSEGLTGRMPLPGLSQLLLSSLGSSILPLPSNNQSVLDAMWMRQRNLAGLGIRNNALATMMPFAKLGGVNQNSPFFQMGAMFANDPNGFFAKAMSPIIGGNPIAASMNAFANMRGMNMTSFGSTGEMGMAGVNDLNRVLSQSFYKYKNVTNADIKSNAADITRLAELRGMDRDVTAGFNRSFLNDKSELNDRTFTDFKNGLANFEKTISNIDIGNKNDLEGKSKAQEAANEFLNSVTDQTARDKMSKAISDAIAKSDPSALARAMKPIGAYANDMTVHGLIRENGRIPNGINFAATYGFNLDDLMKGFTKAVDQRLLGNNISASASLSTFLNEKTGAVGALSAARGFYGSGMGMGEMVGNISNDMGVSDVNLNDPRSAKKIENYYRGIKATARQLNIDPQTLAGLIGQGKMLAANTPGLQYLGGIELGNLTEQAVRETAAAASVYDNVSIRRMGGTQGMAQSYLMGKLRNAQEPISQQLAALYTYAGNAGNTRVQEEVKNYMSSAGPYRTRSGNVADHTQLGLNKFISEAASSLGTSRAELSYYIRSNKDASAAGFADLLSKDPNFDIGIAGKNARADAYINKLVTTNPARTSRQSLQRFFASFQTNGDVSIMKRMTDAGISDPSLHQLAEQMTRDGTDVVLLNRFNKRYRERNQMVQRQIADDKKLEENLDKRYAFLHAPTSTVLMNQLFNGEASKTGISAFANGLMDGNGSNMTNALMGVNKLNAAVSVGDIADVLQGSPEKEAGLGLFGNVNKLGDKLTGLIKLSDKYGITGKELTTYRSKKNAGRAEYVKELMQTHGITDAGFADAMRDANAFVANNETGLFDTITGKFTAKGIKKAATQNTMNKQMDAAYNAMLQPVNENISKHLSEFNDQVAKGGIKLTDGEKDFITKLGGKGMLDAKHLIAMQKGAAGETSDEISDIVKTIRDTGLVKDGGKGMSDVDVLATANKEIEEKLGLGNDAKHAAGLNDILKNVLKTDSKQEEVPALLGNIEEMIRQLTEGLGGVREAINVFTNSMK